MWSAFNIKQSNKLFDKFNCSRTQRVRAYNGDSMCVLLRVPLERERAHQLLFFESTVKFM